jgi:hypothetical protein
MPFYKRDNENLISTDFLEGPGIMLSEASKDEHTYPVEGWYWFADLDAAMQGMQTFPDQTHEEMMKEVRGRA